MKHRNRFSSARQMRGQISWAWLVPLIALAVAGSWLYRSQATRGPEIQITLADASGIEAGKTPIKIRAVQVGAVTAVSLAPDSRSVRLEAELARDAERFLTADAQLWVVRPRVGLSGVSGLETVLSGPYIEIVPGQGAPARSFVAETEPPIEVRYPDAAVVALTSDNADNLAPGDPVYHRGLQVGEIASLTLEGESITVTTVIEHPYAGALDDTTRFWQVAGFDARLGLEGVSVSTINLRRLLVGGVAFGHGAAFPNATPTKAPLPPASTQDQAVASPQPPGAATVAAATATEVKATTPPGPYPLFDDLEAARRDVERAAMLRITLVSQTGRALPEHTEVRYRGLAIGEVGERGLAADGRAVTHVVYIRPEQAHLVRRNSRFWQSSGLHLSVGTEGVEAHLPSLADALASRVALATPDPPGERAEPGDRFALHDGAKAPWLEWSPRLDEASVGAEVPARPLLGQDPPDHQVRLHTTDAGAIRAGSPVTHLGVAVGRVASLGFRGSNAEVEVLLDIERAHRRLIGARSRFWRVDRVSANLTGEGVRVETPTASGLLAGEIRFRTFEVEVPGRERGTFELFSDLESAEQGAAGAPMTIYLEASEATAAVGAPLHYRGIAIGHVKARELTRDAFAARMAIEVEAAYAGLIRADSHFWINQPLDVDLGLSGVQLSVAPLGGLLSGGLSTAAPPGAPRARAGSVFLLGSEPQGWREWPSGTTVMRGARTQRRNIVQPRALEVLLEVDDAGSLREGQPLLYRGIRVGQLGDARIERGRRPSEARVVVPAEVEPEYANLVRTNSRFWEASGLDLRLGLSGLTVAAASVETLLSGGIAFSTEAPVGRPVRHGHVFTLGPAPGERRESTSPRFSAEEFPGDQ